MKIPVLTAAVAAPFVLATGAMADIDQIIDAAGDGFGGNPLDRPRALAVAPNQNVYIAGGGSDNTFRVNSNLQVAVQMTAVGDGTNPLTSPFGVCGDDLFGFYSGTVSDNVFRNRGSSLELVDETGDGMGNPLDAPYNIALNRNPPNRTVYVAAGSSDNAFSLDFTGAGATLLIDSTGDGTNPLDFAFGIAVDAADNVYVTGAFSDNVFKIEPGGAITQIIDSTGDGTNPLDGPFGVAVANDGTAYVTGSNSDNAFRIDPDGTITQIIDSTGNGAGTLDRPFGVAVDSTGNVYVTGSTSDNLFKVQPDGTTCIVIDASGDGANDLDGAEAVAIHPTLDWVYVTGPNSDNAFRINGDDLVCAVPCPEDLNGDGSVNFPDILAVISAWGNIGGPEDLDGSGTVDFPDLLAVLSAWGPC